jgi:hypothetical protein
MSEIMKVSEVLNILEVVREKVLLLEFPETEELKETHEAILYRVDELGWALSLWKNILLLCDGFNLDIQKEAEEFSEAERNG